MHRLTTDKPVCKMSMVELAHNNCYVKDGWAQYRDYERDIEIKELARGLLKQYADGDDAFTSDNDFADYMIDALQQGLNDAEGLIAVFYRNMWAMADLRERLKDYEDLEEQGKLLKLPCAVGDTLYRLYTVDNRTEIYEHHIKTLTNLACIMESGEIGKTAFLTKAAAESALKELTS